MNSQSDTNWGMWGHDWAVRLLEGHVANGNLRHAYLFTGPAGVGRRTLALRLAQAINCPVPPAPGHPCQACRTCTQIADARHPDLAVVQAEHTGAALKVDQIRELQRSLSLAPYQARYRVALLLRFEEANPSAANALLKTLEEPAPQVVLLLTAESPEALLPTVVSRCEVLRLRPVSGEKLQAKLVENEGIPAEDAELLAQISGGRPGYAQFLHRHPEALEQRRTWLDDHQRLLGSDRVARFAYAEKIARDKPALRQAIRTWESLWRDVMLRTAGLDARPTNVDRIPEIEALASQFKLSVVKRTLDHLEKTLQRLDRNVNTRLATEVLLLNLPFFDFRAP